MAAQPLRLVREQAERGRVCFREAEAGEADELVEDAVRNLGIDSLLRGAGDEAPAVRLERVMASFPAHRPPQSLGFPHREPGERDRDFEHLVLEDDDAEGRAERLSQELVVDRPDVRRIRAQPLARLDVRMHRLPLDRPRPDERHLGGEVVEVLRLRAEKALHLRATLDLERAHRVRALDVREDLGIVEGNPREVDHLSVGGRDLLDAVLDRGEHPEAEQVDLEEACIGAGVLVPLAELATGHGRGLDGDELDQRACRDDHPARMLRDVPWKPCDLARKPGEGPPALGAELALAVRKLLELLSHPARIPSVREPGQPLELGKREPERLADVADRATRAVGGEARHERRVLSPVALGDRDDQLLADVAWEVEVDVRHRRKLVVQEAAEREVVRDRIDVGEAGEVADDRADRAAASSTGRKEMSRRVEPAHLERSFAGELEHLVVEEEEPGEPELVDQRELVVQAGARLALATACWPLR